MYLAICIVYQGLVTEEGKVISRSCRILMLLPARLNSGAGLEGLIDHCARAFSDMLSLTHTVGGQAERELCVPKGPY